MQIIRTPEEMRALAQSYKRAGKRVGLVPTMGFLHDGHLSLVREARLRADVVVSSIFVNPTQFGPKEDLDKYPRDFDGDAKKLASAGCDVIYAPEKSAVYPQGFDTYVVPDTLQQGLCGASRPDHFRGVCTVVLLLFRQTLCDVALFGEKDFQQLTIIKRMTRDLWLDVDVVGMPIVREADGLAMSSRNVYLSPEQRRAALSLSRALNEVREKARAGETHVAPLVEHATRLISAAPGTRVDYVAIVDAQSLAPLEKLDRPAVCAVAAFVGTTRLIDNMALT